MGGSYIFRDEAKFQSYQFMQINPDEGTFLSSTGQIICRFNRINSCRSIPTQSQYDRSPPCPEVSIVSIQADQSRRVQEQYPNAEIELFQSYQFRQINPDISRGGFRSLSLIVSIVSIQADQSRLNKEAISGTLTRTVSIVSIQADQSRQDHEKALVEIINKFQSYQFRQINPDELKFEIDKEEKSVSIVSIQADQSRPDRTVTG